MKNNFFSPVQGGYSNGYTFSQFLLSFQRLGLFFVIVGFMTLCTFYIKEVSLESFLIVEGFLLALLIILIIKTLQKWSSLKNHTSR